MNDEITGKTIRALTMLACEIRRDWQEPGVADAVSKAARHPLCRNAVILARAVVTAAEDERNRTPAVIALDGRHWYTDPTVVPLEPLTSGPLCSVCPKCSGIIVREEGPHRCVAARPRGERATAELAKVREALVAASASSRTREQPRIPVLPAGVTGSTEPTREDTA